MQLHHISLDTIFYEEKNSKNQNLQISNQVSLFTKYHKQGKIHTKVAYSNLSITFIKLKHLQR